VSGTSLIKMEIVSGPFGAHFHLSISWRNLHSPLPRLSYQVQVSRVKICQFAEAIDI
jgi:hypothetical protein